MLACPDRRIARVLSAVAGDLSKRATLTEAAAVAGLWPEYFSRLFRRLTGVTFAEWNARARVEEAKRLLCVADLSVSVIAVSVGYSDVTTFTRLFRRLEGTCPRQYRREALQTSRTYPMTTNAETRSSIAKSKSRDADS